MNLSFEINKQCLKRIDKEKPVANSQDYLYATFKFSDDWKNTSKIANFWNAKNNQIVYEQRIDNNICLVPFEVLEDYGCFYMTLRGVNGTEIITTNQIAIVLGNSGKDNGITPNPSQPSMLLSAYSDFDFRNENDKIKLTMIDNAGVSKEMSVFQQTFNENKLNTKVDLPNLLNIVDVAKTTTNGITYKIENGIIYISGNPTSTYNILCNVDITNSLSIGSTYSFKSFDENASSIVARINIIYNDRSYLFIYSGESFTFTDNIQSINFYVDNETTDTISDAILKPILVLGDTMPVKFLSFKESVAVNTNYYTKNEIDNYNTFSGNKTFNNNVVVQGNFTVQGTSTTINTQTVSTKDNIIELASGRSSTTPITGKVGLEVKNYDGTNKTGQLVFDNSGIAYVGDSDDLQPLATRDSLTDGYIPKWNSAKNTLVNGIALEDIATKTEEINLEGAFISRITASDTTNSKFEIVDGSIAKVNKIAGRCITSPNLLNIQDVVETTINGITYKIENGVITLNGTATNNTNFDLFNSANIQAGTYSINWFKSGNVISGNVYINLRDANMNSIIYFSDKTTWTTTTIITNGNLYVTKNAVVNNFVIKPMLVEGNVVPSVFEPYFSGIKYATPTTLTSTGNNLLNIQDVAETTKSGITYSIKNGVIYASGTPTSNYNNLCSINLVDILTLGTTYYLKSFDENSLGVRSQINIIKTDGSYVFVMPGKSFIFTNDIKSIYFYVLNYNTNTLSNAVLKPMLVFGNTAPIQFEPYTKQVLEIPNVATLNGLSDTNFDLCDYIDYKQKKVIRNLGSRDYQDGDTNGETMITDGETTIYLLNSPIAEDIEINDDTYLAYNLGTETLDVEIPCLTEITYNADINAQVVENADNIAELKVEIKTLYNSIISSLNADYGEGE